jgi:hypothetical protein
VWLVYRCVDCDFTWNLTVVERATPETIGAVRLAAYHRNDVAVAWSCAFDGALLRRAGVQLEGAPPVRVEREMAVPPAGLVRVRIELAYPVQIRLDRLLAQELGIPRSRVPEAVENGTWGLRRPSSMVKSWCWPAEAMPPRAGS